MHLAATLLLAPALGAPALAQLASGTTTALLPQAASLPAPTPAREEPQLRVLLQQAPQVVVAAAGGPLQLRDGRGVVLAQLSPGRSLTLQRAGQGIALVGLAADSLSVAGSAVVASSTDGASSEVVPSSAVLSSSAVAPSPAVAASPVTTSPVGASPAIASPQVVAGGPTIAQELWVEPLSPDALLVVQQRQYRGRLQLRPQDGSVQVINHVRLEAYLPGVVGSEMPASWPQPALRAQAVAARTYALRQLRPDQPFDLKATVASQVYKGIEAETASTLEAVAATRGQVLTYNGSLIEAVFHSSSVGSTEASGEIWAQQLPYLVAVPDFDEYSPVRSWQESFGPEQLRQLFAETGGVVDLVVLERTASGRVRQLRIDGPRGQLLLSGAALRQRLNLRSTLFDVELLGVRAPGPEPAGQGGQAGEAALVAHPLDQALPELPPLPGLQNAKSATAAMATITLVVHGRGFGHGVGMSQWGAYGLARRGADHGAILSHYYPGTQLHAFNGP